jgi:hypothetical protein
MVLRTRPDRTLILTPVPKIQARFSIVTDFDWPRMRTSTIGSVMAAASLSKQRILLMLSNGEEQPAFADVFPEFPISAYRALTSESIIRPHSPQAPSGSGTARGTKERRET